MPKSRKRPKKKAKDQQAQFVEAARCLGIDMDEESFKRAIGKVAKADSKDASDKR